MNSSLVYLTQTDTTVGFLSKDSAKLSRIKQRSSTQKVLQVVDSFRTLSKYTRVPKRFAKMVRRAKQTTFIYPNSLSFRVVDRNSLHHNFIVKHKIIYSTSANKTKQKYDKEFAIQNSDIIVYNTKEFFEQNSSSIYKLGRYKLKKIR